MTPFMIHNGISAALIMCGSYSWSHGCYVFMCAMTLSCSHDTISHWSSSTSAFYTLSPSSSEKIPRPWAEHHGVDTPVKAENRIPQAFILYIKIKFHLYSLLPSTKRSFAGESSAVLIYGYKDKCLESSWILWQLSNTILVGSPLVSVI